MPTIATAFRPSRPIRPVSFRADIRVIGLGICSAIVFLILFLDALLNPRAFYDLRALQSIQNINLPYRDTVLPRVEHLTDASGAIAAWLAVLTGFIVLRRWAWACIVGLVPLGGVINLVLGTLVTRARPHVDELLRTSLNPEERSFPSGHVMGAVMLYGIVIAASAELRHPVLRWPLRGVCLAIIVISGFQRLWVGAHWPSDVIGGYALGGLLLACLLLCKSWVTAGGASQLLHSLLGDHLVNRWSRRIGLRLPQGEGRILGSTMSEPPLSDPVPVWSDSSSSAQ